MKKELRIFNDKNLNALINRKIKEERKNIDKELNEIRQEIEHIRTISGYSKK